MEYTSLVAITGKSGLYQMVKPRPDGLIVKDLTGSSKTFLSSRKFQFTPLENIGIYLNSGDTVELKEVLMAIHAKQTEIPIDSNSKELLRRFFMSVLPDHDVDKVKISDIKKMLSWYSQLNDINWFSSEEEE